MGRHKYGFTLIEAIVGAVIVGIILSAGPSLLKPINQSFRKARILTALRKVENEIRSGIFYQQTFLDLSKIEIKLGSVLLAKHQQTIYVSETLEASSTEPIYPIKVRFEVATNTPANRIAAFYQIQPDPTFVKARGLGLETWPSERSAPLTATQFLDANLTLGLSSPDANAIVELPESFATASTQRCSSGFLRGISPTGTVECWRFARTQCPVYSVAIGYEILSTGEIQVKCEKMNKITCPPLNIRLNDGSTVTLNNFNVLSKIAVSDFFPPRTSAGASECTPIINFALTNPSGSFSPTEILSRAPASMPGACPDMRLYKKSADGSCVPTFNPASVPLTNTSSVLPTVGF